MDDPMKQLRFKKNILLANLVAHFREQQEQRTGSPVAGITTSTRGLQEEEEAYDDDVFMEEGGEGSEDGEVTEDGKGHGSAPVKEGGGEDGGSGNKRGSRWGGMSGKSEAAAAGSRHVWVGNLPNGVKEEHLREIFKGYGGVESVRMLRRTPQSMTGFLHFKETAEAIRAKKELDGKPFVGGKLPQNAMKIQFQSRGINRPLRSIRVHNLPPKTTSADLVELFSEFGRVEVAVVNVNSNIGFLALENVEQADRAMARWHDNVWRGRHFFIDYALRENISKEDPYPRGDRDRLERERERSAGGGGRGGGGGGGREREREREKEREREREKERERSRDRGRERERERSMEGIREGRGGPPRPSRYDDRDRDRMRGPPLPFPQDMPHIPNRLLVLPSARGCPPFEVYAEDLEKLRELVDLMQSHLAPHQRQTLEDALQNRALYEGITQLIGRNRRDMGAVLRDLRLELGLPPSDHRRGPPLPPLHHHQPPHTSFRDHPIPSHPRDRAASMPLPPPFRDGPFGPGGDRGRDLHQDRERMRYHSPPPSDYRRFPPPGHPDHHLHHSIPPPHHYDRSSPHGGYRDDPRLYSPDRRGGEHLPPIPPPGYRDDRRGPPSALHPSSLGPPPIGYGDEHSRERDREREREREHGRERERYGGGRDMPSPPHSRNGGRRRSRSRSPPRGVVPPPLPPYPGDQGRKRSRDRPRGSLGRSRSRSPSNRRHRAEGGVDPRAAMQLPPGPPSQGRDTYPPMHNHLPPPMSQNPPRSHRGGAVASSAAFGGGAPPPLKAECDQFLQSLTGGLGSSSSGNAAPSSSLPASQSLTPGASASTSSRIWLNSGNAATYACYDAALNLIKELLTPHYRAQVIDKNGFKRLAEEVTLLLVQQLLEHRLEGRVDVPAHYKRVAENLVREALQGQGAGIM